MRIHTGQFGRSMAICLAMVIIFTWTIAPPAYSTERVQGKDGFFHEVREINTTDLGIPNPSGLAYLPKTDTFQIIKANPSAQPLPAFAELDLVTMDEEFNGTFQIPAANLEPMNSIFDKQMDSMLILNRSGQRLFVVPAESDGNLQPSMLLHHNIKSWRLKKPKGMTIDQNSGQIFVLDLSGPRLVKIVPSSSKKRFEDVYITEVDLRHLGIVKPQGLAFDPATGHLHLFSQDNQTLYEITQSGKVVATRDLSTLNLNNPQSLVFAPSFDQTDNPEQMSLYIADSGEKNQQETGAVKIQGNNRKPGRIIELSLYEPVAMAASTFISMLNNTIDTSKWTPPSPDPCGVEYIPSSNTLLISDSEVEEMSNIWANANIFETTLDGTLIRTVNTTTYTKEPTGLAYNSANGHMFISDDSGVRVFEVDPGADSIFGSSDDVRTVFKTSYFNSNDPEGVAFDSTSNTLFIIDGVNEEVYLVKPGANGRFDGVQPYGDDEVTSFDTATLGIHDPEGIAFNSSTGHLYIINTALKTAVAEVTVEGALVQVMDISAASAIKPSGIGFGPSSANPAMVAMYVTDRGIDNNYDPTENDGKVYELTMPNDNIAPPDNSVPTVSITSPTNGATYTEGDSITFSGSASDPEDGNLSEGIIWTSSRDGEIGNGSSFNLSTLTIGTHTITAEVSDSKGATALASVTITVNQVPVNSVPTVSIINPINGAAYTEGDSITFSGSANDSEDGDLSEGITWTSSQDGTIGTGDTFSLSTLTVGTHIITAAVTDSEGAIGSASVTITVNPEPKIIELMFNPTDDATVNSRDSKTKYGSETILQLIKSKENLRSYLKFNVTGLSDTIKSAKLRLYSVNDSNDGGSVYVVLNDYKGTNTPWLESDLSWKNAPNVTGQPLSTVTTVAAGTWVEFDVTIAINGDGEYSFALVNTSSQLTIYNSSEADLNPPELIIETMF